MSGSLPWSPAPSAPMSTDPAETLRKIEQNTGELVRWTKILVAAIAILIVVTALLI